MRLPILLTAMSLLSFGAEDVDSVVAMVGSERILSSEVREALGPKAKDCKREDWTAALDTLVERKLLLQAAKAEAIELPASEVEAELRTITRGAVLAPDQKEKLTERLREQMLVMRLFQRKLGYVAIAPKDIRKYYEEHKSEFLESEARHLRMIVVPDEATAKEVMKKLAQGEKFADLAKANSVDPQKESGGDWGWILKTDLREPIGSEVFSMAPGEIRGPIPFQKQYAILSVEAVRPQGVKPLSDVAETITDRLTRQELLLRRQAYVDGLRKRTNVVLFEDRFPK